MPLLYIYFFWFQESWKVRGIIPRALEVTYWHHILIQFVKVIFQEIGRRNIEFNCFVSFMEIYNEQAFDLLDRRHMENSMEDWTKVTQQRVRAHKHI